MEQIRKLTREEEYQRLDWVLKEVGAWVRLFVTAQITGPIGILIFVLGYGFGIVVESGEYPSFWYGIILSIVVLVNTIAGIIAFKIYGRKQLKWREKFTKDIRVLKKK